MNNRRSEHDDNDLTPQDTVIRGLIREVPDDLDRDFADRAIRAAMDVDVTVGLIDERSPVLSRSELHRNSQQGIDPPSRGDTRHHADTTHHGDTKRRHRYPQQWIAVAAVLVVIGAISVSLFISLSNGDSTRGVETAEVVGSTERAGDSSSAAGDSGDASKAEDAGDAGRITSSEQDEGDKSTESAREGLDSSAGSPGSAAPSTLLAPGNSFESAIDISFGGTFDSPADYLETRSASASPPSVAEKAQVVPPEIASCSRSLLNRGMVPLEWIHIRDIPALVVTGSDPGSGSQSTAPRSVFIASSCTAWN